MWRGGHGGWHRLGLEHHGVEVEELAVVLDDRLAPEPPAHVDGLVDPATAAGEVEPDRLPLRLQPAGPDAELRPSAGDDVEGGDRPGHDERVAQADVVDLGPEADPLGLAGQEAQVGEDIEDRDVGRDGGMVRPGERDCRPPAPG